MLVGNAEFRGQMPRNLLGRIPVADSPPDDRSNHIQVEHLAAFNIHKNCPIRIEHRADFFRDAHLSPPGMDLDSFSGKLWNPKKPCLKGRKVKYASIRIRF